MVYALNVTRGRIIADRSSVTRAKLSLYKDLHGTIQARRDNLSEREESLKAARDALVRDGASVVSGGVTSSIASGSQSGAI